mmetsp:Transcript_30098/g.69272  ORF Transcript_30098/g.69272 Transcript_30098/m.69272 type:complete len:111 (-) Transcript_30098:445-777(-)
MCIGEPFREATPVCDFGEEESFTCIGEPLNEATAVCDFGVETSFQNPPSDRSGVVKTDEVDFRKPPPSTKSRSAVPPKSLQSLVGEVKVGLRDEPPNESFACIRLDAESL